MKERTTNNSNNFGRIKNKKGATKKKRERDYYGRGEGVRRRRKCHRLSQLFREKE